MKLSLVYHVYKNNNNLETSLNSIATQSDKEFEFILINDGATQKTLDILTKYNLISICKNIKYIFSNTNRGHAFSFNEALKQSNNSYIYYMGSNIVLEPDFIKTINETIQNNPTVDVISITHLIKNTEKELLFHSLSSDLKYYIGPSSRDKIFSISFLKKNNIKMNENGYFSIEFLYQVLLKFKTWIIINQQLIQYSHNTFFTYNLYDIFQANDLLIRHHSNTIFWKKNRSFLEFLIIIYITRIFLPRIFFLYKDNDVRKGATRYSINWLNMNLPKWQENSILNSDRVNISETTKQKILNIFKRKFLKKILSII